jgi:microcystin degradation protein MlrC
MSFRVGILGLAHESNTFYPKPTPLADFEAARLMEDGASIRAAFQKAFHEIGGFLEVLDAEKDIELLPLFSANATPSGAITQEAERELLKRMFAALESAGKLDGLMVAPHGAGVGVEHPDLDGNWLTEVRRRVGPNVPMICTLDPHANLSKAMVDATDATLAYRTNPHLDQRQRGVEAAKLMLRTLRGEVKPVQAAAFPNIAINIERQLTADSPCREMYERFQSWLAKPGILTGSVILGFPYADVAEMGSAFTFTADGDRALAQKAADDMANWLTQNRESFRGVLYSVDEALDKAQKMDGPVCLLDMGDNVGGGAPADGTLVAHGLLKRNLGPSVVCIFDPAAAKAAHEAGVGADLQLSIGGHTDSLQGPPLEGRFRVTHICDGNFTESEARHGGRTGYKMGPTAVLQTGKLSIIVTTRRTPPFSLGLILCTGLDPASFRYLVAKGVHAPVAAYAPICGKNRIRVNTPGITTADMHQLQYQHRRKPLFPFED